MFAGLKDKLICWLFPCEAVNRFLAASHRAAVEENNKSHACFQEACFIATMHAMRAEKPQRRIGDKHA